jgi:outer membrane protein assembly factor BamB
MKRIVSLCLIWIGFGSLGSLWAEENWPEFRGPTGNGHSTAKGLPAKWSETENVKWKTAIHDRGWSSPVVWGNQVWLTTATTKGDRLFAVGLDRATGKIVHDLEVFAVKDPQFCHDYNTWASCTPVVEEGRLYAHYGSPGTACIDTATGKTLWSRQDLECNHHRGAGSSPILYRNLLILTFDGFDVQYLAALDKTTGKTAWKTDRKFFPAGGNGDTKKAYSTPTIVRVGERDLLVSGSADYSAAYDPLTGAELWRVKHGGMNAPARAVSAAGNVFLTSSDGGDQLVAVKPDGTGDITKSHVSWKFNKGVPNRSSLLTVDDNVFMVNSGGISVCLDAKDGKERGRGRIDSKGSKFVASPLFAEGKIYLFDEDGGGYIMDASKELTVTATNRLAAGCMASPAAVGKTLFVRTKTHMYALEAK